MFKFYACLFLLFFVCTIGSGLFAFGNKKPSSDFACTLETKVGIGENTSSALFALEGVFMDASSLEPIYGVSVKVVNTKNNLFTVVTTNEDGFFQVPLHDESVYQIQGSKARYFDSDIFEFSTIGTQVDSTFDFEFNLEEIKMQNPYLVEGIDFSINEIKLTEESIPILAELAEMLKKQPEIVLEIGVHTDSRGSDTYNLTLSQRRAEEIIKQLNIFGIDAERLIAFGYGESQLLNQCENGVKCSFADHAVNRRVEFKVIDFIAHKN